MLSRALMVCHMYSSVVILLLCQRACVILAIMKQPIVSHLLMSTIPV